MPSNSSKNKTPLPKSQRELEDVDSRAYDSNYTPSYVEKNRANNRRVDDSTTNTLNIGLKDIDETIVYYFNNVIRPSVIQNGSRIAVPIIYGSPERWTAVQKDGFYRDKNGKIMTPLIMFKRDSVQKNRNLGNKLDANNPVNYGIFEKRYSKKNVYDRFSIVSNRRPVREFYGVVIPDYVNLTYSCIIFTDYIEQMNKIIESINYASDSYWGDPERFKFRAMIDNYTTAVELNKGQDRAVKTNFLINMFGYIVSDTINTELLGSRKFFSNSKISFKFDAIDDIDKLNAKAKTPEREAPVRFFDTYGTTSVNAYNTLTLEQILYLALSNAFTADTVSHPTATFTNRKFATPPDGVTVKQSDFKIFINGILLNQDRRVVQQVGSNVVVTFNGLEFDIDSQDQIIIVGKIE